ncbi:MAG: chromate transporter, partial [Paludibacteraceae bacterium]|nr:chromate transporter [Paludibacteraceae bacterium]
VLGAMVATFAIVLPSFMIMLVLCRLYLRLKGNAYIEGAFVGLRPVVVGLIASAALLLMNTDNFIDYKSYLLFVLALIGMFFKVHPILLIILAGCLGLVLY